MSYEIPQQLEYQEKIIFGLTFSQLFYAIIFFPIAIAILLKLPLELPYRVAIALIPSGIGLLFMFTKIPTLIKNIVKWLQWREFSINDEKMKKYLNLDKIETDIIHLRNKQKLSIIKIEPINFSLRNNLEKQIVISMFQKFLNSLDFQIQITIATDSLNLDTYLAQLGEKAEEVSKKSNKDYNHLFNDFKTHMANVIATKGLLNRSFYLIIPEKDGNNLGVQIAVCEELLKNMNLKFTRLKDEDLLFTIASFFNDVYNEQKDTKNDYFFTTVAPQLFRTFPNEVKYDETFARTIAVKGYPRSVEEGFLDKIITINGNFDIAIHIEPYNIEFMMIMLNKELQKQRADLWSLQNKGMINPTLEIKYNDTKTVLENVQKGNEKLFNVSLYITCKAKTLEELNILSKKIESDLNALLMIPHVPVYEMHNGILSTIPLGMNKLNRKQNVTTKALSAFFPFTSQFLQLDESGILLGLNKNNIPIIKDIFKLYNANGIVLASSGGGKSYFTKLMIARLLLNGTKVMVIDPQAEYIDLVERFNGELITISRESESIINPLDLMGHDYDEKKLMLLDLFPVMLGQTSEIQKAVLDRALSLVFEQKGITNDKTTWRKEPPLIEDLLKQLKAMSKNATKIESETYRSLINRIEMYVSGVFSFMNRQTNLNFNNRFVCFNIGDMPNQVKPTIMFLILDYVYMKMKKDIERKILVVDEAWSLLERTEDEGYIFKIVKTCRKFNLGLLLITQDVGDLLKNDAGKALLNNSEYTLLLRQKPSIIDQVEKTFKLSQNERDRLLTATAGEGILIIANEHTEIKVIASPEEHSVITTNADERLKKEMQKSGEIVTTFEKSTVDYAKGFYRKKEITKEEIEDLVKNGYILSAHIGLYGGRLEEYLLKPRYNESAEHFFVIKAIEEYLRKYTVKVELYETRDADIVFEISGKRIAIEVETGAKLRNENPRIELKVQLLTKRYGNDWFFVVTDWKDKEKYKQYGEAFVRKEVPAIIKKFTLSQVSNSAVLEPINNEKAHFEVQNVPVIDGKNFETLKQDN
ncbi:ATP-binding protein [Candidatus Woesearchaeota archaeon]|nr:ATP-binding protein [Candidatus Woesearchaeota archaeon]